ncbi:hypothetical protein AB0D37_40935 [Streptomyces sp. NPDC048384]|uniref:hypothetical protein n=1 Tax=Streptomyces sp. NPDC048384 TaxID=3155487 RepID=UPI003422E20C
MTTRIQWRPIRKSAAKSGRSPRVLIPAMTVAFLLIAAIALAGRDQSSAQSPTSAPDMLAPEIPHSREGAQSAAAKVASALGSEAMFGEQDRHSLIQLVVSPDRRNKIIQDTDADYGPLARQIGLDAEGRPPAGANFVSRTMPAGTTVRSYTGDTADVSVWCSTLFGLTAKGASDPIPVETGWITMSLTLRWTSDGWRLEKFTQQDGPEPTAGAVNERVTYPKRGGFPW